MAAKVTVVVNELVELIPNLSDGPRRGLSTDEHFLTQKQATTPLRRASLSAVWAPH